MRTFVFENIAVSRPDTSEPSTSVISGRLSCLPASKVQRCLRQAASGVPGQQHSSHYIGHWSSLCIRHRSRTLVLNAGPDLGDLVSSQDEFDENVGQHPVVVVDWMAKWCRKCIYLKPKLTKMLKEEFPGLPVVFIDVNAVPGTLIYDQGIRKMPTITIYKDGQKVREHIAAEGGLKAVTAIRDMIKEYVNKESEGSA